MISLSNKRIHKHLPPGVARAVAVVLLTVLFVPHALFASDSSERQPVLVDPDFVQLSLTQDTAAKTETLVANSKEGGSVDWVTYVIQLDPSEVGTVGDIVQKTGSNRSTFKSEDNVAGMIYVPAKSAWRYLDISSVISDAIMGAAFGKTLGERVTIPSSDGHAYIVRSYSGAYGTNILFGAKKDPEERVFVISHVDGGNARTQAAFTANVIAGGFDAFAIIAPVGVIAGDSSVWKDAMGRALAKEIGELELTSGTQQQPAFDFNAILRMTNGVGKALLTASNDLIAENMDTVQRTALERSTSFFGNIADAAFSLVSPLKKISKGGQVAMRISDMIYATPLETAYVINTPLLTSTAKDAVDAVENTDAASVSSSDKSVQKDTPVPQKSAPVVSDTSAGKSATKVAAKKLTIQFVNQYGEPFRGDDGWEFYFPRVYDSVGEEVPGHLYQNLGGGLFEFSEIIPEGGYTIKWGDFWFNAPYGRTSVRREIQGAEAKVVVPNQGNWFVSIPAKQISISYLNGGGYVHLLLRNEAGTPLTLGISDGQGTVVNAQGKKVGTLGWVGSAGSVSNADRGAFFVGIDKVEDAIPGVYTIEIKRTGYKPKSVTYTLPDVSSWTDEKIIAKQPGVIDLGTIVLQKE